MHRKGFWLVMSLAILALVAGTVSPAKSEEKIVRVDGSSTVYPITEAVAEEFGKLNRDVKVTVGISGTGGGFAKFCRAETDISDASRPISKKEIDACGGALVEFIEIPVAYDGLAVVVNPGNEWVKTLTIEDLKKMWAPEAQRKVVRWNQVRPEWPDASLKLFGPGVDSGTFDYFTEAVTGKAKSSRGDYTASEDDNVLVQGVSGDRNALGYFGLAYYEENSKKLKLVAVDGGKGPILPTKDTVRDGTYAPLSRPLFIYVAVSSLKRPEVKAFVDYYLKNAPKLVTETGYIPLPDAAYKMARERFEKTVKGSVFAGRDSVGVKIEDLLKLEGGK